MVDPLSKILRELVDAGIASMEQLETVLAVQRGNDSGCTLDFLAAAMRTTPAAAQNRLELLKALGIVGHDGSDPECWSIVRTDLLPAIHACSEAMGRDRQRVVYHFYAHRLETLQAFSDAFRLRKDT